VTVTENKKARELYAEIVSFYISVLTMPNLKKQ